MKSIFISGGCGGFGLAVARIFRNEGNIVGLGDLRPPADDSFLGDGITFYELDVTKPESWDAALSEFTKLTGGRLDILDTTPASSTPPPSRKATPTASAPSSTSTH